MSRNNRGQHANRATVADEPVEQELGFEEFVETFLSCTIGEKGSMTRFVSFDCESPAKVFEMLLVLYTEGLKRASDDWQPGKGLSLAEIPKERIDTLSQRFAMIGISPTIDIMPAASTCASRIPEGIPRAYTIDNKAYLDKANLADMVFTMGQDQLVYRISFKYV